MTASPKSRRENPRGLKPRVRVMRGAEIALGPGKIELLEAAQRTGSLSQAAKSLRMSYMRAWLLVRTMNRCFKTPLVHLERGGRHGGKAVLTELGLKVLALYTRMEASGVRAMTPSWNQLGKFLKSGR